MGSEFRTRLQTALVIGVVIIGSTLGGVFPSQVLVVIVSAIAAFELRKMCGPRLGGIETFAFILAVFLPVAAAISAGYFAWDWSTERTYAILPVLFIAYSGIAIAIRHPGRQHLIASMGIALLLFAGGAVAAIDVISFDPKMLLATFILLWTNDTMAYVVGSRVGRNKIAPAISPGKTWEGTIGGALFCAGMAALLSIWLDALPMSQWMLMGSVVAIAGTMGDLLQSVVKRYFEVKDSGNFLPGHGGMWDRFDSFFGCIPFVAMFV